MKTNVTSQKEKKEKKFPLEKCIFKHADAHLCQAVMKTPKDAEIPVLSLKNQALHSTVRWSCCASI